jgi:hypothetical protein
MFPLFTLALVVITLYRPIAETSNRFGQVDERKAQARENAQGANSK